MRQQLNVYIQIGYEKKNYYRLADTIEKSQKQGVEGQVIELN